MNRYHLYKYTTHKDDNNILLDADMKLGDKGNFVLYEDHIKELEAVKNRVCECTEYIYFDGKYCRHCGGKIEIKSGGK